MGEQSTEFIQRALEGARRCEEAEEDVNMEDELSWATAELFGTAWTATR